MNSGGLKVLMISTDRNILAQDSPVSLRIKEYGRLVEELHIVVMSDKRHGLKETKLASNVWVYPTNSLFKFMRPRNAASLGKKLVAEKKFVRGRSLITTQDPFECGWAGLKIKKKWRIPLEVQLHTDPFSANFSGFLNMIRKRLLNRVIPKADSIRVVSESIKSLLPSTFYLPPTTSISVLPIYIDKEKIENASLTFDLHARTGWKFVLLTVSRLTEEKNIPLTLQVLALLRQRYPSIGLVIVGAGPEEKSLKLQVKSLKLEQNVVFEGWQNNLASYYKSANAYIQTSYFEGYGMSLVEAGLSGLPVVTTRVGIANDLESGKEAYICPFDQSKPEEQAGWFANAIADLVDSSSHRENLKINMKMFLDKTLLNKEEYLESLQKNWKQTALKVLN